MMIEMINQPEDFKQWFGCFITTPRHELDIAAAEPPYEPQEVLEALQEGQMLTRLGGLRMFHVSDAFFVNSERFDTVAPKAAEALCRYLLIGKEELGEAVNNPTFIAELTGLINQGYWYFDE